MAGRARGERGLIASLVVLSRLFSLRIDILCTFATIMDSRTRVGLLTNGEHELQDQLGHDSESESWREKPKCKHAHCRKGLFHDRDPQHTHAQCHTCHQMARCKQSSSSSGTFQLRRCANCHMDQYCVSPRRQFYSHITHHRKY